MIFVLYTYLLLCSVFYNIYFSSGFLDIGYMFNLFTKQLSFTSIFHIRVGGRNSRVL
jgi:hypothetical protein